MTFTTVVQGHWIVKNKHCCLVNHAFLSLPLPGVWQEVQSHLALHRREELWQLRDPWDQAFHLLLLGPGGHPAFQVWLSGQWPQPLQHQLTIKYWLDRKAVSSWSMGTAFFCAALFLFKKKNMAMWDLTLVFIFVFYYSRFDVTGSFLFLLKWYRLALGLTFGVLYFCYLC